MKKLLFLVFSIVCCGVALNAQEYKFGANGSKFPKPTIIDQIPEPSTPGYSMQGNNVFVKLKPDANGNINQDELHEYVRCASTEYLKKLQAEGKLPSTEEFEKRMAAGIEEARRNNLIPPNDPNRSAALPTQYNIPVIFHIIHRAGTAAAVTPAQVTSQMSRLNLDYMDGENASIATRFKPVAADVQMNFCLAKYWGDDMTPLAGSISDNFTLNTGTAVTSTNANAIGVCYWALSTARWDTGTAASGGNGTAGFSTSYIDTYVKQVVVYFCPENFFNVWVVPISDDILGYATFPDLAFTDGSITTADAGTCDDDGVVINPSGFGTGGTAAAPYNLGKTLVHEAGHFFGLRHIWGDDADGACPAEPDYCNDTPKARVANTTCPGTAGAIITSTGCATGTSGADTSPAGNSGNGVNYQDHMDYTADACLFMFTAEQKIRTWTVAQLSPRRKTLPTSQACKTLPTTTTINASKVTGCIGDVVTFKDNKAYSSGEMVPTQWIYTYTNLSSAGCTMAKDSLNRYSVSDTSKAYGWTPPTTLPTAAGSTIPVTFTQAGQWKVKITARIYLNTSEDAQKSACPQCNTSITLSDSVIVTINPKPTITLASNGSCPPLLSSTAANVVNCGLTGSSSFPTYAWSGASSANTASTTGAAAGGVYNLQVTDGNGCTSTASITVGACAIPAPIELISFEGNNAGNVNNLDWVTAQEQGNDHFEVERSGANNQFEKIGTVKSKGDNVDRQTYQLIDQKPLAGVSYYRLKQVDKDGKSTTSNTIALERKSKTDATSIESVFPNPSKDAVTISINSPENTSDASIEVLDMGGKRYITQTVELQNGATQIPLNISALPQGDYLVKLTANGVSTSYRFVKK